MKTLILICICCYAFGAGQPLDIDPAFNSELLKKQIAIYEIDFDGLRQKDVDKTNFEAWIELVKVYSNSNDTDAAKVLSGPYNKYHMAQNMHRHFYETLRRFNKKGFISGHFVINGIWTMSDIHNLNYNKFPKLNKEVPGTEIYLLNYKSKIDIMIDEMQSDLSKIVNAMNDEDKKVVIEHLEKMNLKKLFTSLRN